MQSERQQYSWRINLHAKAKSFNFRFRATTSTPTSTLSRFSIFLKLRNFVFRVNAERRILISQYPRRGFFRTRVVNVIQKFRARIAKNNRPIAAKRPSKIKHPKDPIRIGIWVMWFLAFVAELTWKKYQKGVIILASVGIMVAVLMKKDKRGKFLNKIGLWIATMIACFLLFDFEVYWDSMGRYASKQVWELISSAH